MKACSRIFESGSRLSHAACVSVTQLPPASIPRLFQALIKAASISLRRIWPKAEAIAARAEIQLLIQFSNTDRCPQDSRMTKVCSFRFLRTCKPF